nr:MAG TPA: hypothetical protein [Caudoviricetes sp.]
MYYIDFDKLKIHFIDSQNFNNCMINLCGVSTDAPYKAVEKQINTEVAAALDKYRASKKDESRPVAISMLVPQTGNDDRFEFMVNSILGSFANWNLLPESRSREKHLDCPKEFIHYLFLARNYSKKFTNRQLKINAFTLNIKERSMTDGALEYERLDNEQLKKNGATTINAR